jgi:hypothetical protein
VFVLIIFSDSNSNLKVINDNKIDCNLNKFSIFSAISGSFGLITSNHTDELLSLYVTFIKPREIDSIDGPYYLYDDESYSQIDEISCNFGYTTLGYTCIFNMKKEPTGNYFVKVDFRNTGFVIFITVTDKNY